MSRADLFKEVSVCRVDRAAESAALLCSVEFILTAPKVLERGTATWVTRDGFGVWSTVPVAVTVVAAASRESGAPDVVGMA